MEHKNDQIVIIYDHKMILFTNSSTSYDDDSVMNREGPLEGLFVYPAERREFLLNLLNQKGFVSIRDLALELQVSEITVRRDLKALQREGLVEKVAGGGQPVKSSSELPFLTKRVLQQSEKARISQRALSLIEPGMTIGLSAGTTTWTLAQLIRPLNISNLTFVTNSTNVAMALHANGWTDIHLTGGQFRTPSDALVGPLAEESARRLYTDMLFLGTHGIHLDDGLSSPNVLEASMNRVMMDRANTVVLLFDHTKWGIRALAHLAMVEEVDIVITDGDSDEKSIEQLQRLGPEVFVV
jgi:DeoR/GlpR family transcriptional regulator of sugar metabolism